MRGECESGVGFGRGRGSWRGERLKGEKSEGDGSWESRVRAGFWGLHVDRTELAESGRNSGARTCDGEDESAELGVEIARQEVLEWHDALTLDDLPFRVRGRIT